MGWAGRWGADSAGNPDPRALAESDCAFIGRYIGTPYQRYGVSRGWIDDCLAVGVGVLLIMEEWSSQFLTGYQGAVASCGRMMDGWDALGAPRDGSVLPAVALVDPTPGAVYGAESALQAYARGWDDALPFPEWMGYGSKYGLDLAGSVTRKMTRKWGVGTWGYGEAWDGSLPDWAAEAAMIQHGNRGAPVAGCDYNSLSTLYVGQWGGTAPTPTPPQEANDMERLVKNDDLPPATETEGNGWWYFPPTGQAWEPKNGVEVLALADTGIPSFHSTGQKIVVAIEARKRQYPETPPQSGSGPSHAQEVAVDDAASAMRTAATSLGQASAGLIAGARALDDAFPG